MARLMAIPIRDETDAVLIVTNLNEATLMGYVTQTALSGLLQNQPTMSECLDFVERHLPTFERILAKKSKREAYAETSIDCVEVNADDLAQGNFGIAYE
jgi:hypothetical protein